MGELLAGTGVYPHTVTAMRHDHNHLNVEDIPLEEVKVPTLIVHGDKDKQVPYEHAFRARDRIPNAELYTVEGGSHLLGWGPQAAQVMQAKMDFAAKHL